MTVFPTFAMQLARRLARHASNASWRFAALVTVLHAASVAAGLWILDERALVSSVIQFFYFYTVTGSSVGYGDFSPSSPAGKLFTALWVIPGAISIFAFVIGKIVGDISMRMRAVMNGMGQFTDKTGHLVIIGWVQGQTDRLIEETARLHGSRDIVVVSTHDLASVKAEWDWVRASSLANRADLERAGIDGAAFVVVLAESDDESLTACLAIGALAPRAHCVAYFGDPSPANLVERHCPMIETVTSTTIEHVARSLSDPGASDLLRRLVSTRTGATLHSTRIKGPARIEAGRAMTLLLEHHGATLIGFRPAEGGDPVLSLAPGTELRAGQTIYYISVDRLADEISFEG
ncbi:voltage-gated potassium channel [Palleronia marisminoris]|uniref:Voltage-gated potassium channel Kch n=1 Tax=Palleronia marisminoris TaxID=315423 RepID=A0A1Y5RCN4_9RHOB|nr:ion channel [Palleronia marisminoris]SFG09196.1 voltage-gated potassium channel [Palleronia marisminoris]SLN11817.1 Voltage-gated potassium channel Kch [Palleronia marisminoris]